MKVNFETIGETAVHNENIIEEHNNEKIILRFLVCGMHYHGLICLKKL